MACSKFEYVKKFEVAFNDVLLPHCYIVIRIDGHNFHSFSKLHQFKKPNDERALNLANHCAKRVLEEFTDIVVAYGQSDEYSFIFKPSTTLYKRRASKLMTLVVSLFTSCYCMLWPQFFGQEPLQIPPSFDARAVLYPSVKILRDYLSWRQADCHINNLYNTAFWALVLDQQHPHTEQEAQKILKDTDSAAKNELLFSQYGINYAKLPEQYRKGSVLYRQKHMVAETKTRESGLSVTIERERSIVIIDHCDIISDAFWEQQKGILDA